MTRKRGAENFEFTMPLLGVFTIHCTATFHGGNLVSVFGRDDYGSLIDPDGVILDWGDAGEFLPFTECMKWHAVSLHNESKEQK